MWFKFCFYKHFIYIIIIPFCYNKHLDLKTMLIHLNVDFDWDIILILYHIPNDYFIMFIGGKQLYCLMIIIIVLLLTNQVYIIIQITIYSLHVILVILHIKLLLNFNSSHHESHTKLLPSNYGEGIPTCGLST